MRTRLSYLALTLPMVLCLGCPAVPDLDAEKAQLLAMHREVMAAHLRSNPEPLLRNTVPDAVFVRDGELARPTAAEREQRMRSYLGRTRFSEYRDLQPPIVQISQDASLAWIIVQVKAGGIQSDEQGNEHPLEFVSAWIELYEKQQGRWVRTGFVSTFKPGA